MKGPRIIVQFLNDTAVSCYRFKHPPIASGFEVFVPLSALTGTAADVFWSPLEPGGLVGNTAFTGPGALIPWNTKYSHKIFTLLQ